MEKIAATMNNVNAPVIPNRSAESHVYEPQPWFYARESPPAIPPTKVDGLRVVHDTSMCKPYGLFRIFNTNGEEIMRQLSHP